MNHFIGIVIGTIIGNIIWGYIRARHYKYNWKCPTRHSFVASSNSRAVIESVKAAHTHD